MDNSLDLGIFGPGIMLIVVVVFIIVLELIYSGIKFSLMASACELVSRCDYDYQRLDERLTDLEKWNDEHS